MLDSFQLDAIYIASITISTIIGYLKVPSIKISNPAVLFYSIFFAIFFAPHAIPIVNKHLQHPQIAKYVSIFILYSITIVAFMLIISAHNKDEKKYTKHKLDKIYGILFGCIRGFLISFCCCIFILIFEINKNIPNLKQSPLSSTLFKIAERWMPENNKSITEEKTTEKLPQKPDNQLSIIEEKKKEEPHAEIQEKPQEQDEKQKLSFIKYIADFFSKRLSGLTEIENKSSTTHVQTRPQAKKSNNFTRAKYGCMSLLEARIKRRAQLKKKRIEREILKQLNDKNKINDENQN